MNTTEDFPANGFSIIDNVYTTSETDHILSVIKEAGAGNVNFRKSTDLFAIRQFLKEVPSAFEPVFNNNLKSVLKQSFPDGCFVVKSIYFDKPPASNWYVPYHQDLTISVDKKHEVDGFEYWTTKHQQYAVQPPPDILQNIVTIRIHLDNTDENNGALKVIPGSHLKGIYRPETIDWSVEKEMNCCVPKGGIMLMKPLLLHSSGRTTNNQQRRVIHIEFASRELPEPLTW